MRDGWRRVPLAEVAELDIDRVRIEAGNSYRIAGVLNGGKGLFERETISGSGTTYRALHRLRAGQLVMRKLTAWEGPISIVPLKFDGLLVSAEFPTFTLRPQLLPGFMTLICQQPHFWDALRERSTGTVQRRKRVSPQELLRINIDLPPLPEQRRIVDLVDAVDRAASAASGVRARAATAYRLAADAAFGDSRLPQVPLASMAHITIGRQRAPQHVSGDHVLPYLRAANVKDGELELDDVLAMNFDPSEQDKFRLEPGDVLVTEGCGSLRELGASAQWMSDLPGTVCFQNTLLRLRARPGVSSPELVHHLARWAHHAGRWARIASGTNIFHIGSRRAASMSVPAVPLPDQEQVGALLTTLDALRRAAQRQVESLVGLRRTAVADLLSGDHEIPATYDRFLEATQ